MKNAAPKASWMLAALVIAASVAPVVAADYLSPVAVVVDKAGKTLYVAEHTASQVAVVDLATEKVTKTMKVSGPPTGVVLSPDSAKLYVTWAAPAGGVDVLDAKTGKKLSTIAAGHTPISPTISADGKMLYVCNQFNNNVSIIDLKAGKAICAVPVGREPVGAAVTPDGKTVFVANQLPSGAADGAYVASTVSVIDTVAKKVAASITFPNGSTDLKDIVISPDGKYAYVTHILARYHLPTTQLERGWMNTNAMSIIDVPGRKMINTILLDDVDKGAANPYGVTVTADGKQVVVTHAGTHEVSIIDVMGVMKKLAEIAAAEKVIRDRSGKDAYVATSIADVPNDLAFLVDLRRRIRLAGNGPRGVAVVGTKVYAAEYFTDTLGVLDINPEVRPFPKSIPLGPKQAVSVARKGERFFHDAELCFQTWQSCSSCHPEGRNDGLNWDLLNDGLGNPKNTKSMLLAHQTPPAMITGVRARAEVAVRSGIRFIQFAVRPEEDAVAIDTYLKSMKPVPSPYLVNGKLSASAQRGKKVYEKAGCAACHSGPYLTDKQMYNVGTGKDREAEREFDTPALIEAWRTGPYLYDGRAATIQEVLTKYNNKDQHGKTSKLTKREIADLAEYVLSH